MQAQKLKGVMLGLVMAATILAIASPAQAGDSWWTNWSAGAAGQYWINAANWTNAAGANAYPDNGHAYLTRTNASYTVFYTTTAPAISNLFIQNMAGNTTMLIIR